MTTKDATLELVTTGYLCNVLQATPHQISSTAARLGIAPALRLNDVAHFDVAQVEAIAAELRSKTPGGL